MKKFRFLSALVIVAVAMLSSAAPVMAESLVFVSDLEETGNWDLYIMDDVDTPAGVRRLTDANGIDNHADLSPDGTKIVWSSTFDYTGANGDGDFEIYTADLVGDPLVIDTGSIQMLTDNDYPDRHPHFNHDPANLRIIYTAKYVCVDTTEKKYVTECSIPRWIDVVVPCGRKCEGMRIMDAEDLDADNIGDNRMDIDHAYLTNLDPSIWPLRPADDARWIGHPSFAHDDSMLLFSGAVDGDGNYWEVYVMDWDPSLSIGSSLRQVTLGSLYPPNDNPIQMSAGAHFSEDDATILFSSTRTLFGNSQLFEVPAGSSVTPVSPLNRHPFVSELCNVYVPEPLEDGRIMIVSDIEEYTGMLSCKPICVPPVIYTISVNPLTGHTVRLEGTGLASPLNPGGSTRIHLDAYELDGVLVQEDVATTYAGVWMLDTSPNASGGYYMRADGSTSSDSVTIAVPIGTSLVTLHLGQTPFSGIVQVLVDASPYTTYNLHTPDYTTGNDIDIIAISPDGSTTENLTDNNFNDEVLLIGDEVSWFCGLSPNLSLCTYLPKYLTVGQLGIMLDSDNLLPDNFPKKDLYPISMAALQTFMESGGNGLRPHNAVYWEEIMIELENDPNSEQLIVIPIPSGFCLDSVNHPPTCSSGPVLDQTTSPGSQVVRLPSYTDQDGDTISHYIYISHDNGPFINAGFSPTGSQVTLHNLLEGQYRYRVVTKDSRGGQIASVTQTFCLPALVSDVDNDFQVRLSDFAVLARWWLSSCSIDNTFCDRTDFDLNGSVGPTDAGTFAGDWTGQCAPGLSQTWFSEWEHETQCHGDADGLLEGSPFSGYYHVGSGDLSILVAAYNTSSDHPDYDARADFNRDLRVNEDDLDILQSPLYWMVKDPPHGPGIPHDCQIIPW